MLQVIDPSVADEGDPFSSVPELDMYDPDNGWRPWPEPCTYDRDWLARYRAAQRDAGRPHRRDRRGGDRRRTRGRADAASARHRQGGRSRRVARPAPARPVHAVPDDLPHAGRPGLPRPRRSIPTTARSGSLFAFPDPLDANYGRGGLARTMTARGWLSTWSGLSSHARLADTMPQVTVPTLIVHPTADTEIRVRQAGRSGRRRRRRHDLPRDGGRPALPGTPRRGHGARRRLARLTLPLTRDPPSHQRVARTSVLRSSLDRSGLSGRRGDAGGGRSFGPSWLRCVRSTPQPAASIR